MGSVPAWARVYVACVVLGALACLAPLPGSPVPWWAVVVLAALYAACEQITRCPFMGHRAPPGMGTFFPVLLAGAFLLPVPAAALVAVPGALVSRVEQRPRGLRRSWRAGRLVLAVAAGIKMAALLAEGRFATGDDENLLGAGASQIRILGIAAAQFGTFSPHVNAGYVVRSGEFQNDAIVATLGFDNLMTDWSTLAAGLVSEFQIGESQFTMPGPIVYDTPFSRQVHRLSNGRPSGNLNAAPWMWPVDAAGRLTADSNVKRISSPSRPRETRRG